MGVQGSGPENEEVSREVDGQGAKTRVGKQVGRWASESWGMGDQVGGQASERASKQLGKKANGLTGR